MSAWRRRGYPSGVGAVSGVFGLPVPGHKFVDAIYLVIGEALENPCEPCLGIDVVQLAGFHERVGDGGRLPATDGPHEQIIFPSKGNMNR